MTSTLPQFIVLSAENDLAYVQYRHHATSNREFVVWTGHNVFSTHSKIEVERGTNNPNLVHLRFCANNRYWERRSPDPNDSWIVATSNQPEEDTSKSSCTLFRPTLRAIPGGRLSVTFHHVQSGGSVQINFGQPSLRRLHLFASTSVTSAQTFDVVDWDSLVILPPLVTFKGFNDKYLKSAWIERHEYHQFSGDDGNKDETTFEVTMTRVGNLRIRSNFFGKIWRRSPNWIWADTDHSPTSDRDNDTMFWPVKIDDHTIALRNLGNNMFCRSLTTEGKTDCLNASATTAIREALLAVQEPVSARDIYNVRYRLEDARIYDEEPFIAGTGSAVNNTGQQGTLAITVSYEDTQSSTFTNSLSLTAGFSYTFTAGIPAVKQHEISVSAAVTAAREWGQTNQETRIASATYTAIVPPLTSVRVNYVGTKGKCNIPFSYTQRVRLTTTGSLLTTEHHDGIFMGVNAYNYHFEQLQFSRL